MRFNGLETLIKLMWYCVLYARMFMNSIYQPSRVERQDDYELYLPT